MRIFGGESSGVRRQLTCTRGALDTMYQWRPSIRFQSSGFSDPMTVAELRSTRCAKVPSHSGIYLGERGAEGGKYLSLNYLPWVKVGLWLIIQPPSRSADPTLAYAVLKNL